MANPLFFNISTQTFNSDGTVTKCTYHYADATGNSGVAKLVVPFVPIPSDSVTYLPTPEGLASTALMIRDSPNAGIPYAINPTGLTEALGLSFIGELRLLIAKGVMSHAEVLAKVGSAPVNVQDWMLTCTTLPNQINYKQAPNINADWGGVSVGTIASSQALGIASAKLTVADVLDRPTAWLIDNSGIPEPWSTTGDFAQAVATAWSNVPAVNNFTVNGLGYVTGASATITPSVGTPVPAHGALSVVDGIATQMAVVYLGRPASHNLLHSLQVMTNGAQPTAAAIASISATAIADGAFGANDTSAQIVINTFKNIMGFLPSAFEQQAWGQYIDNGTLTTANAPWIIFQSYLGANNVPAVYQQPTQARFVAAQTFTDYTTTSAGEAALDGLNTAYSAAARAWLAPVDSVAHAANKMTTMMADIAAVTLVGIAPADAFHS